MRQPLGRTAAAATPHLDDHRTAGGSDDDRLHVHLLMSRRQRNRLFARARVEGRSAAGMVLRCFEHYMADVDRRDAAAIAAAARAGRVAGLPVTVDLAAVFGSDDEAAAAIARVTARGAGPAARRELAARRAAARQTTGDPR